MNNHFLSLPDGYYPVDGCALLVRDAWLLLYGLTDLPIHANRFVTMGEAGGLMSGYKGQLVEQIPQPEHGCMVTGVQGRSWHCGVYSTEQMPGHIIHTVSGKVKIEPLRQFKQRFDHLEFYKCLR